MMGNYFLLEITDRCQISVLLLQNAMRDIVSIHVCSKETLLSVHVRHQLHTVEVHEFNDYGLNKKD